MTKFTTSVLLSILPFIWFLLPTINNTSINTKEILLSKKSINTNLVCDPDRDRQALIDLYNATDGDNWINNTNWRSDLPISDWHGITAISDCVTEIDLNNNALSGTIPISIGDLSELQYIDLRQNNLSGSIPTEIGNLTNLLNLSLYENQLTGEIPSTIGNLTLLKGFSLNDNQFSGSIPDEIGQLTQLENIFLSNSGISGEIPITIGNLINLQGLFMTGNGLTNIPSTIGNLSSLTSLYLSNNAIIGGLPTTIGNLTSLEILALGDNIGLGGTIPESLGNLTQLKRLYLYNNGLTGSIPESLANLRNLEYFYLFTNQLEGCFPEALLALCDRLSFSNDSDNPGYDLTDNPNLPNDGDFTGFCVGTIISCETENSCRYQDSLTLVTLYNSLEGDNWTENTNWLTDQPINTWYGVTVNGEGCVSQLYMTENNIGGQLPPEIGKAIARKK